MPIRVIKRMYELLFESDVEWSLKKSSLPSPKHVCLTWCQAQQRWFWCSPKPLCEAINSKHNRKTILQLNATMLVWECSLAKIRILSDTPLEEIHIGISPPLSLLLFVYIICIVVLINKVIQTNKPLTHRARHSMIPLFRDVIMWEHDTETGFQPALFEQQPIKVIA